MGCASALHASILREHPALSWRCVSQDMKVVHDARAKFFSQVVVYYLRILFAAVCLTALSPVLAELQAGRCLRLRGIDF